MIYSKIRQILPLFTLLIATVMWAQDPQYQMSSDPLEIRGDSVILTLDITIPDDQVFDERGTYVITPRLGAHKFPSAEISVGRDGPFRGTTVTKSFIAPLKSGMHGKELKVNHHYVYGDQEKKFDDATGVAECCITTGNLYVMNAQFDNLTTVSKKTMSTQKTAMTSDGKTTYTTSGGTGDVTSQVEPVLVVGQINFPVDNAQLASNSQGDHITAIGEFLQQYPDAKIEIHGYASPEGPYARNTELARQRASTTKNWLVTQLNDKGYSAYVHHANIHVSSTSEDWEGFRYIVQRAGLSDDERQRILELTDAAHATALDAKEGQIFTGDNGNDPLEAQLRPLRRTTIRVTNADDVDVNMAEVVNIYSVNNASEEEIKGVCLDGKVLGASQMTHATEGKVTMMSSFHAKGAHQDNIAQTSKATEKKQTAESQQMQEPAEEAHGQQRVVAESKETQQSDEGVVIRDESSKTTTESQRFAGGAYDKETYVFQISDIQDITAYDIQTQRDYITNVADETLDENFKVYSVKFRGKGKGSMSDEEYTMEFKNDLVTLEQDLHGTAGVSKAQIANNLGALYIAMGETEVAKGYLKQAYEINPDAAAVNYNLQLYYLAKGNFEKALWHADRAKTIEGSSYNRALALLMTGQTDNSISELYQFVNSYPEMAAGHYLFAIAAARSGEPALMSKHLSRAVNLNPALGDVAAKDLEFRAYWKDDMFARATVANR